MLYYLVICFFIVGSGKMKVLEPDSPDLLSLIGENENANASANTLLSQIQNMSVNPKDVTEVIKLVDNLIKQGSLEISHLDRIYKDSTKNVLTKKKETVEAQLEADKQKRIVHDAKEAFSNAETAYDNAKNIHKKYIEALHKATFDHKVLTIRRSKERPLLENQVKVLRQVRTLLLPIGCEPGWKSIGDGGLCYGNGTATFPFVTSEGNGNCQPIFKYCEKLGAKVASKDQLNDWLKVSKAPLKSDRFGVTSTFDNKNNVWFNGFGFHSFDTCDYKDRWFVCVKISK